MNKERLSQMVTMLRNLPPEKFDITDWQCGTTACAVGHACLNPVFQMQGLHLKADEGSVSPAYGQAVGWYAVEEFFEIDTVHSERFFHRWAYPVGDATTANDVADRIESFLTEATA